jgi:hypothetical protein
MVSNGAEMNKELGVQGHPAPFDRSLSVGFFLPGAGHDDAERSRVLR